MENTFDTSDDCCTLTDEDIEVDSDELPDVSDDSPPHITEIAAALTATMPCGFEVRKRMHQLEDRLHSLTQLIITETNTLELWNQIALWITACIVADNAEGEKLCTVEAQLSKILTQAARLNDE